MKFFDFSDKRVQFPAIVLGNAVFGGVFGFFVGVVQNMWSLPPQEIAELFGSNMTEQDAFSGAQILQDQNLSNASMAGAFLLFGVSAVCMSIVAAVEAHTNPNKPKMN